MSEGLKQTCAFCQGTGKTWPVPAESEPPPESAPLPAAPPRHHPGCGTWTLDQTGKPLPCSCTPEVMRPAQASRDAEAPRLQCVHAGCTDTAKAKYAICYNHRQEAASGAERPRDVESAAQQIAELEACIMALRPSHRAPGCWCPMGWVGHSAVCMKVRSALSALSALSEPGTAKGGR